MKIILEGHLLGWIVFGLLILFSIMQFVSARYIENAISHRFDKKLAEVQHEYEESLVKLADQLELDRTRKEKAAIIAEVLAVWAYESADKKKLNQLSWEASMWLPDHEAKDLNDLLAYAANRNVTDPKQMIINGRKLLLNKETTLTADDIVHFEND